MREWIIGLMVVIIFASIMGYITKADAQEVETILIDPNDGGTDTIIMFCETDSDGTLFCWNG